jgi:hypothetical protein
MIEHKKLLTNMFENIIAHEFLDDLIVLMGRLYLMA